MTTLSALPPDHRLKARLLAQGLRDQGLRPITQWVPDIASPQFDAEAHCQSLAAAAAPDAEDD